MGIETYFVETGGMDAVAIPSRFLAGAMVISRPVVSNVECNNVAYGGRAP